MRLLSNYVPVLAKILYASISKLYRKLEQHKAYLETSVGVVGVVAIKSTVETWDLL